MIIYLRSITGKTTQYFIDPSITIAELKEQIYMTEGVPVEKQALNFHQVHLLDSDIVERCGIQDGATLQLALMTKSGPLESKGLH